MSYPTYWRSVISKFEDFRTDLKHNRFKRNTVRITIDSTHKTFRDNKRRTVIDLESSDLEDIVDQINTIIWKKELELEEKIKNYESAKTTYRDRDQGA